MTTPVRIGFIPLMDAALLLAAERQGFAEQEGLALTLVRDVSWANLRDKLNLGYLDAAHMLAPAAIASSLGLGHVRVDTIAPMALNLNGNAITLSLAALRRASRKRRMAISPIPQGERAGPAARDRPARRRPGRGVSPSATSFRSRRITTSSAPGWAWGASIPTRTSTSW